MFSKRHLLSDLIASIRAHQVDQVAAIERVVTIVYSTDSIRSMASLKVVSIDF